MKRTLFPTVIIDDFFVDPDYWRHLALSQEFSPDLTGKWPGSRSPALEEISPKAFQILCEKIFKVFNTSIPNYRVSSCFQRIPVNNKVGWVHSDAPVLASIVIYLNKEYDPRAGTSLYSTASGVTPKHLERKMEGYLFDADVEEYKHDNNNQWKLDLAIPNKYNRMVLFDSCTPHTESMFSTSNNEDRLTLITFIHDIDSSQALPLLRVSQAEF